ncbi:MAG: hypothetical protein WAV90_03815 [Gordonia amarae]
MYTNEKLTGREIASLIGMVAIIGYSVHSLAGLGRTADNAVSLITMVAAFSAALIWIVAGRMDAQAAHQSGGYLVGTRIRVQGADFVVMDDTAPSLGAALRNGGRSVVSAADSAGRVGLLFVGFDAGGSVVEAATSDSDWQSAQLVG